ncbi:MAG TPA: DUF1361 domain-containing protein [Ferruginibacter sp.]|jgi:uncharacterized membrane protein|nr:DUF1361 domain-containing protein [Ferruginibacter sp.]
MKTFTKFDQLLWMLFAFTGALIFFRIWYSASLTSLFLVWNIFLAWIPYVLSRFFELYRQKQKWKQALLFGTWLLFFPNALYIVTDLVHIDRESMVPWWYDVVLLFMASLIGIVLGFVSLRKAERFLRTYFTAGMVSALIALLLFLGSFGVYLGRFERWNSWDVVHNPLGLAVNIMDCFINPVENYRVWGITVLFTLTYYVLYFFMSQLPKAISEMHNTGR